MRDTFIKIGSVVFLLSVPLSSYIGIRAIETSNEQGPFGFTAFPFWFFVALSLVSLYTVLFAVTINNKSRTEKILIGIGLAPLACIVLLAIYSGIATSYLKW